MTCLLTGLNFNKTCGIFDSFIKQAKKQWFSTYLILIKVLYKLGRGNNETTIWNIWLKNDLCYMYIHITW